MPGMKSQQPGSQDASQRRNASAKEKSECAYRANPSHPGRNANDPFFDVPARRRRNRLPRCPTKPSEHAVKHMVVGLAVVIQGLLPLGFVDEHSAILADFVWTCDYPASAILFVVDESMIHAKRSCHATENHRSQKQRPEPCWRPFARGARNGGFWLRPPSRREHESHEDEQISDTCPKGIIANDLPEFPVLPVQAPDAPWLIGAEYQPDDQSSRDKA